MSDIALEPDSDIPTGNEYDVHVQVVVSIKTRVTANHFAEAIEKAESCVLPAAERLLETKFPGRPLGQIHSIELLDEVLRYLVDFPDDKERVLTMFYARQPGHSECFIAQPLG